MRKFITIMIVCFLLISIANGQSAFNIKWGTDLNSNMRSNTLKQWAERMEVSIPGGLNDTGANVYFVDNNAGSNSFDGKSWSQAFLTITYAMSIAHANIATSPHYADRIRIYVKGDDFDEDFTLLAQKTDIIGVGSDDGAPFPTILGNHVIDAQTPAKTFMGTRFFNMGFLPQTSAALWDIPANQHQIGFYGCTLQAGADSVIGIKALSSNGLTIMGCRFIRDVGNDYGFLTAAIYIDNGTIVHVEITNNWIDAEVGIYVDSSLSSLGCSISGNYIHATTFTIDENSDSFWIANNTLITDTTIAGGTDVEDIWCVGNIITGSDGTKLLPLDTSIADIGSAITALGASTNIGFRGDISSVGTTAQAFSTDLSGFGDDYFEEDWVVICIYAENATPEGEIVDITAYTSSSGLFAVSPSWGAALATTDRIMIVRREWLAIDGVALKEPPAAHSLSTFIAGTTTHGTPMGSGKSIADALGTNGSTLVNDAVSVVGIIGIPTNANNAVDSSTIQGNDDGSLYERLEALLVDITAILLDTDTGVALGAGVITSTVMATGSISADEMATDAIDADVLATNTIGADEIAANAIGASELATDAIGADELAADALAEIEAEATDALEAELLNKLLAEATADATDPVDIVVTEVADDSVLAQVMTQSGDASDFERLTDSLEALGINLRTILGSAGEIWYVDDAGTDSTYASSGFGVSWANPFDTIDYALDQATENDGAVILVRPGHVTTLGAATESYADAGITVIGMGTGENMSKIIFDDTASLIAITANVTIINMWFESTGMNTTIGLDIEDTADGTSIIGCLFTNASGFEFLTAIDVKGGADRVTLKGNTIINTTGADALAAIGCTDAPCDRLTIEDNYIYGKYDLASIWCDEINTLGHIVNNTINNTESGIHAIEFDTTATGWCINNTLAGDVAGLILDPGSMSVSGNTQSLGADMAAIEVPLVAGKEYAMTVIPASILSGADALFTITGGPIEVTGFYGVVTGQIGAASLHLQTIDTATTTTLALSTTVDCTGDIVGTTYTFTEASPGVLVPLTGAQIVANNSGDVKWFIPVGTIHVVGDAAVSGTIEWTMTFRPLKENVVVADAT